MYRQCYFRIESNDENLSQEETYELYDEIVALFEQEGWKYKRKYGNGYGPEIQKGKSELYIHPR